MSIFPLLLIFSYFGSESNNIFRSNIINLNNQIRDDDIFPEILESQFYKYITLDSKGNPIINDKMISLIANEIIKNINTYSKIFFDHIKISNTHHKLTFCVEIWPHQSFNRIYDVHLDV